MTRGMVFDIQRFSVHDGPGIRTTVFLKGCPLRCVWCHNPESWAGKAELLFNAAKCAVCGRCVPACPHGCHKIEQGRHVFNREFCVGCGKCVKHCLSDALELCGQLRSVEEVISEVLKDKLFYDNSGGGITLSGGEPMAQFDFTQELLKRAKEAGLHVCLETCGFAPQEHYARILPFVDIFLYDLKTVDSEKHRRLTGQDLAVIHGNLRFLDENGAHIRLRCPLVPGVNDSEEELRGIGELAETLSHVAGIDVEPYHPLGVSKARQLGMPEFFEAPFTPQELWSAWIAQIARATRIPVGKQ